MEKGRDNSTPSPPRQTPQPEGSGAAAAGRLPGGSPWQPWIAAVVLSVFLVSVAEYAWRRAGIRPSLVDDRLLWSTQRERVEQSGRKRAVFIGSSRMQLGLVPDTFREATDGWEPIQLAVDGAAPLATLRDVAHRSDFDGIVVVSLLPWCLLPELWRMQEGHVRFYHTQWNTLTRLSRDLRSLVEERVVAVNPHVNLLQVIPRLMRGRGVPAQFLETHRSRWHRARYEQIPDLATYAAERAKQSELEFKAMRRDLSPLEWLSLVAHANKLVERLQSRGGRVVFVRFPSAGTVWDLEKTYFPRSRYWDVLARNTSAATLHFQDVPEMSSLPCPDGSHLDARYADVFTRALARELAHLGFLQDEGTE